MVLETRLKFADLEAVGPDAPAGRYLRLFWHPVIRARDLPVKHAKPIEILGEKFTAFRGESGMTHLIGFRCGHRGAQLSVGWVEGDSVRCRYHGWRFDKTGQCVEQPAEERPFCDRVKVPSFPTQEYAGLVFAYLGEGKPPPLPRYADLDQPGVIVTDPVEFLPCSFWNRLDNDHAHVPWTHRATGLQLGRAAEYGVLRRETAEETPYGLKCTRFVQGESKPIDRPDGIARMLMPYVFQNCSRVRAKGFENLNLWDMKFVFTVPVNDAKCAAFDVTHTPLTGEEARRYAAARAEQQQAETETDFTLAERILAGELTPEDLPAGMDAYTRFAIEDYVTQVGQGSIAERNREHLGTTDAKVILFRRLWLREVTAMLENRTLTDWTLPPEPFRVPA
jgi:5,5'-dehydrodivanillate O-demethylase oxygenase subunit